MGTFDSDFKLGFGTATALVDDGVEPCWSPLISQLILILLTLVFSLVWELEVVVVPLLPSGQFPKWFCFAPVVM